MNVFCILKLEIKKKLLDIPIPKGRGFTATFGKNMIVVPRDDFLSRTEEYLLEVSEYEEIIEISAKQGESIICLSKRQYENLVKK